MQETARMVWSWVVARQLLLQGRSASTAPLALLTFMHGTHVRSD